MRFEYELRHATTGALHATGHSTHVWLDNATRRPVTADREVIEAFAPYLPGRPD
jgi:acyl-CoA thioesterase FadM